jgi:FixJ family two-component response regulator
MDERRPMVYIIEDDRELRASLAELVHSAGIPARAYATATAFLAEHRTDDLGCLICDVCVPDLNDLELHERSAAGGAPMPVIFMTAYADVTMAIRALKSGAVEFVEKPFNAQTMLERIQRALAEDRERREEAALWQAVSARMDALTDKEREVLAMILEGAPNKAIAAKAEVTERAVEMRRASIMRKLQVHSLAELIRLATRYEMLAESRAKRRWM